MTQSKQPTKLIHCYDMVSFVTEIADAVKNGYSLDLKTPENYPTQIGYQYIATMLLDGVQEKGQEGSEAVVKIEPDADKVQELVDQSLNQLIPAENSIQEPETQKVEEDSKKESEAVVEAVEQPTKRGRKAKGE